MPCDDLKERMITRAVHYAVASMLTQLIGEITMANKNTTGRYVVRTEAMEDRLIDRIDKRDANGDNMENVDDTFSNYSHTTSGERVWSF